MSLQCFCSFGEQQQIFTIAQESEVFIQIQEAYQTHRSSTKKTQIDKFKLQKNKFEALTLSNKVNNQQNYHFCFDSKSKNNESVQLQKRGQKISLKRNKNFKERGIDLKSKIKIKVPKHRKLSSLLLAISQMSFKQLQNLRNDSQNNGTEFRSDIKCLLQQMDTQTVV